MKLLTSAPLAVNRLKNKSIEKVVRYLWLGSEESEHCTVLLVRPDGRVYSTNGSPS